MADTQTKEKTSVLLTGIDELSPKLGALRAKVESFKKNLEQTGLGKLDISGLFKGGSVITPFVDGIKASAAFQGKLAEVSETAKTVDMPAAPKTATQNLNVFSASMEKVSAAVDAALLPAVGAVVVGLEPLLTGVGSLLNDNPKLVEGLAAGAIAFSAMQTAVTGATQVFDLMSMVLKTNPIMLVAMGIALAAGLIIANWEPISTFFAGLWQKVVSYWAPISGVFSAIFDQVKAVVSAGFDFLKAWFAWTPYGMILNNWGAIVGLFAAIWDLLMALTVPVKEKLRSLFDWVPLDAIAAAWGQVPAVFSGYWESIKLGAQAFFSYLSGLFTWSPLDALSETWASVVQFFSEKAEQLRAILAPIQEMLGGSVGGFIAKITGKVEDFTEVQKKTNADGKGEFAPAAAFINAATEQPSNALATPGSLPLKSSMQPGSLTQNSNTLIQQSAANNRTQLEGGLTVRFENAPAGLRTDQPQTNQPGLSLNSRIGYRSLSMGGSNELA
ncbi:phage tail protein [Pseudomonas sp. B21-015]|uniref:phage tail protein n=1 Tax=Pseudomonas sp. B21-015 TaxID=2895473 RepID=UPI0021607FAA|nr:phage tail protein [Pseudomonas sp. B21-015]UVM49348.1 phage tail protein [Pseudomonas sp. B21-015]